MSQVIRRMEPLCRRRDDITSRRTGAGLRQNGACLDGWESEEWRAYEERSDCKNK